MKSKIREIIRNHPFCLILLVGILIRIIYFLYYFTGPTWNQLLIDSLFHDRWAFEISKGNIIGQDPFFRAPLYIYSLGIIYGIFGHSLAAARIFGHTIGLLSVLITYLITLRLFSKREALIAAILHAIYPMAIYLESELLVETLFAFLMELSIWIFLLALNKKKRKLFLLTGIMVGLSAITRPVMLSLLPIYLIWIFHSFRLLNQYIKYAVYFIIGVFLIIAPISIRNYMVGDEFVLIASSGGINFFIGNNAQADGLSATVPSIGPNWGINDIKYLAEKETGRQLNASALSDFWYQKGLNWITNNKADFLSLYLKKLYYCANNYEVSNNRDLTMFFRENPILHFNPINFALIFSLFIIGLILLIVNRHITSHLIFLLIFIITYVAIISFFFINARFKLPIIPLIIIFTPYAITNIANISWRRHWKSFMIILALGIISYSFSISNFFQLKKDDTANGSFNMANYYLYKGEYSRAISLYHQILASTNNYSSANLNLGSTFLKIGNIDSAKYYFNRELEIFPDNAKALSNLASIFYLKEDYDTARRLADQAILYRPYFEEAYLIKIRALAQHNDSAAIASAIIMARQNIGNSPRLLLDAGLIYTKWGDFEKAKRYLGSVLKSKSKPIETDDDAFSYANINQISSLDNVKARAAYQLGYIYGRENNLQESIEFSNMAISFDSSIIEAYVNLANGYFLSGQNENGQNILRIASSRFPGHKLLQIFQDR
jgi:4-amino-4-deoxy-L-arabinose transferase-like glycosyltransferase